MNQLSVRGIRVRVIATLVAGALLLAGTLWGTDDDFPFGPFRMYSTAPDPNGDARDTRVEGVDAEGRTVAITEGNSGIRRAEIEGQQQAYVDDPSRLSRVAAAYAEHTPGAAPLSSVRIVVRWHGIEHARPTGAWRDEVVAEWKRP
ncbi:hypothetical protein [Paractinoplanes brasiliensis]|uniref:Uncharacterized protein n=1 Tax=Paractinoplanes brasiliensis TaxID=52695 RepID=A0A4R6JVJ7_9ACTN|nr:hypothetical protein [Actinoplanes brasiliensis]TDO40773.1 hypothetical protein C8E87_4492 [Actinoplanes brasiliensis]GID25842.1 hypothetical protein Abr02nite_08250 [Actinoplanes brasiliensis]